MNNADTCPNRHNLMWWCGDCGYLDPNTPINPEFWDWNDAMSFAINRAALTGHRMRVEQKPGVHPGSLGPWVFWVVTEAVPEELRAAS